MAVYVKSHRRKNRIVKGYNRRGTAIRKSAGKYGKAKFRIGSFTSHKDVVSQRAPSGVIMGRTMSALNKISKRMMRTTSDRRRVQLDKLYDKVYAMNEAAVSINRHRRQRGRELGFRG